VKVDQERDSVERLFAGIYNQGASQGALEVVENFTNRANGFADAERSAVRVQLKGAFMQAVTATSQNLYVLKGNLQKIDPNNRAVTQRKTAFQNLSSINNWMASTSQDNAVSVGLMSDAERRRDFLMLVINDGENAGTIYDELKQEYLAVMKESNTQVPNPELLTAYNMYSQLQNRENPGPTVAKIQQRLMDPGLIDKLISRLKTLETSVLAKTSNDLSDEAIDRMTQIFFDGEEPISGAAAPMASLEAIQRVLAKIPDDFGVHYGAIMQLPLLRAKVDDAINRAANVKAGVWPADDKGGIKAKKDLFVSLSSMLGANREFADTLRALYIQYQEYNISHLGSGTPEEVERKRRRALFLVNFETLGNAIGYSQNPWKQKTSYAISKQFSRNGIQGFTEFASRYFVEAFEYLDTIKEEPIIRDSFCSRLLVIPELHREPLVLAKCAGTSIGDTVKLRWDTYVGKDASGEPTLTPFDHRACSYYNFQLTERILRQQMQMQLVQ
jgi:hypothetical protein